MHRSYMSKDALKCIAFPCKLADLRGKLNKTKATEDAPMEIVPLGPGFAAELRGAIDLAQPMH